VKRQGREGKGRTGSSLIFRLFLLLVTGIRLVNGYDKVPNGDGSSSATGTEGTLRRVVSDWIAGGTLKKAVVATYSKIEDWNLARVTNMESVFYNFTTFNGNISSWNVSGVTNLKKGMYGFLLFLWGILSFSLLTYMFSLFSFSHIIILSLIFS